jgi:hypothetical protein
MHVRRFLPALVIWPALSAGCGSGGSSGVAGEVGTYPPESGLFGGPGDAGGLGALDAHIEENRIAVTFVTLSCTEGCATVNAVGTGGYPPYTFKWDDGSTNATRQVCPTASTNYDVKVTDTGRSGELARSAESVDVPLSAKVIACPDSGAKAAVDGSIDPTVYWANWTSITSGTPGSAAGTLSPPQGDIEISYNGEVGAQSAVNGSVSVFSFLPQSTYVSPTVGNGPPSTGMIAVYGQSLTTTIAFSKPVRDPLIAVAVMQATWTFDAVPTVLSSGPNQWPGAALGYTLAATGQSLQGMEGSGVAQFSGTFTSLSFTVPTATQGDFTGLTVGIPAQ